MKYKLTPILVFCSLILIGSQADFEAEEILVDSTPPAGWLTIDSSSICQPLSGSRYLVTLNCKGIELVPSIEFNGELYRLSFYRRHLQYSSDATSTVNIKNIDADVSLRHFSMTEIQYAAANLNI
tara:strand:+ start:5226 stop:5600 length:375 start_codon:yes stop_codon:yes gene_type:complete